MSFFFFPYRTSFISFAYCALLLFCTLPSAADYQREQHDRYVCIFTFSAGKNLRHSLINIVSVCSIEECCGEEGPAMNNNTEKQKTKKHFICLMLLKIGRVCNSFLTATEDPYTVGWKPNLWKPNGNSPLKIFLDCGA